MNRSRHIFVSLMLLSLPWAAVAQNPHNTIDASITFSELRANAPVGGCDCFWMSGGTGEFSIPVWKNFSAIAEVAGHHTGNIPNFNVGLSLVSGMGGIRMRWPNHTKFQPFAQVLFGGRRPVFNRGGLYPLLSDASEQRTTRWKALSQQENDRAND